MALFPPYARAGQTHRKFGRKFVYSDTTEAWTPVVALASAAEIKRTATTNASAVDTYSLASQLPLSGNTTGELAFVQETNRLYLWSSTGWYNVATIESAGASISGANTSYTLATDGTPTVVTLNQSGLTSPTWSYKVTSGSLGRTATVTQVDNVFTITPSALARNVGSFGLTFKATDGSNTIVTSSQFTMSNTAPVIGTGPSATYTLAEDGTPTVITLAATDADGHAITWSYEVISGSLGSTTVTNVGSVFTITPSTDTNDDGTFQLRFVASDGAASDTDVAEFTLSFAPDWAAATLLHTLDNPNAYGSSANDFFGWSVAISGDYAIVSAVFEDDGADETGIAYIFNAVTGSLIHTLRDPAGAGGDRFGFSVAISGNYAIVGAPYTNNSSGKAYIFNVVTGVLTYTLDGFNGAFGNDVAMDGNYAIVGAWGASDAGGGYSGKVYIFKTTTGDWTDTTTLQTLDNPNDFDTSANDSFGTKVAISGNYAIVGTPFEDHADGYTSGKAHIFNVTTGALLHTLDNPNSADTSAGDRFGGSVAISGNYAAVGAPNENSNDPAVPAHQRGESGVVYVFNVTTGALVHTLVNPNQTGDPRADLFGYSTSMDSHVIFVGAPNEDTGGSTAGGIYMFDVTTGALILPSIFYDNGAAAGDWLGKSVSVSGSYAIAGAPERGTASGVCKIFQAG
jgi:hypothetical protein